MKNKIFSSVLVSLFTLAAASRAHAQQAPAAAETLVATPESPRKGIDSDPNIDRGFLLPTAMTQPAGSLTYNNYELLLHGLTYGITDNVQASLTVLSPIVDDMPFVGFGAVKGRVAVTDRLNLALQGSFNYGHVFASSSGDFDTNSGGNVYSLGAGGFASYCLRQDCSSLLSGSATYQLAFAQGQDERLYWIVYGGSIVHRVGQHVKLLGEVTSAAVGGSNTTVDNMPGVLASYGVRFHTRDIAADVGFVKPIFNDDGDDGLLMGLPFVNVSYRWQ